MIQMGLRATLAIAGATLLLPYLLPAPGQAEGTAENVYQENRQRLNQKTHIKVTYEVVLSPTMKKALGKYDLNFRAWKSDDYLPTLIQLYEFKSFPRKNFFAYQTPSAVIGDFNGDADPDAVMMGHDKINSLTIAIMSGKTGYRVIELEKGQLKNPMEEGYEVSGGDDGYEYGLWSYLMLFQPSKIKANPSFKRPDIDLKTDAVIIEMFEKASVILIYKDDKFVSYTMSD